MDIDDIYSDLIMEHSLNSPYKKKLDKPTCSLHGHNPSCGDDITLELKIENGIVVDASFIGQGCAISQSSTSILIETILNKTEEEAKEIIQAFVDMIDRKPLTKEKKRLLGNGLAFENISNMPSRVKCALLAWKTAEKMLCDKNP